MISTDQRCCKRTIRRSQLQLLILVSSLIALVYTAVVFRIYDGGLDDAMKTSFKMDARDFERSYLQDPTTPVPFTPHRPSYLGWEQVPEYLQNLFAEYRTDYNQISEASYNKLGINELIDKLGYEQGIRNNAHFLLMYPHQLSSGQVLYMFGDFELALISEVEFERFDDRLDFTLPLGLGLILLVVIIAYFFSRRISRASDQLVDWADNLTLDDLDRPRPEFRYAELNRVADQLRSAFQRIGSLLAREHHFLRNASHELRTPIAISRANLELLEKQGVPDTMQRPVERLLRANQTMQNLTETLLWLSRDQEKMPEQQLVTLEPVLQQQCEDLNYLLDGKPVELRIDIQTPGHQVCVPTTALQIVLHNLLRNAFQHTQEGDIEVTVDGRNLTVINLDQEPISERNHPDSIGLGLSLVKQICERLQWPISITSLPKGMKVELSLP